MNLSIVPLHLPRRSPLSAVRVSGWSAALVVHLVAFGLLLLPARPADLALRAPRPDALIAEIIAQVVTDPLPVPPIPPPPSRPAPPTRRTPVAATVPVMLADSAIAVPVVAAETSLPNDAFADPAPISRAAQIAYDRAPPPPYPSLARRRGWHGTVVLLVRVDEHGRPREVQVERSSGRALLDRSASEHVLARWRFQPALLDGIAVGAWARVPVTFRLQQG